MWAPSFQSTTTSTAIRSATEPSAAIHHHERRSSSSADAMPEGIARRGSIRQLTHEATILPGFHGHPSRGGWPRGPAAHNLVGDGPRHHNMRSRSRCSVRRQYERGVRTAGEASTTGTGSAQSRGSAHCPAIDEPLPLPRGALVRANDPIRGASPGVPSAAVSREGDRDFYAVAETPALRALAAEPRWQAAPVSLRDRGTAG
jgi:hypothetical protein